MFQSVDCSSCHTPLELPPGTSTIRCAICHVTTSVSKPRAADSKPSPRGFHIFHHLHHHRHHDNNAPTLPSPESPVSPEPPSPPPGQGRKRAVICGVSYTDTRRELKGCINDAKCMNYLLVNKFKFPESSILVLTEEGTDRSKWPTRENIRKALSWLVEGCGAGDSLVFHYSGHGSQLKNRSGDEIDGFDETLCPMDFETAGMILDDELNAAIVKPLPPGVKLHAVIDACHSGTILDLPFLCRMDRNGDYKWEDHRPRSGVWKGTKGGEVFCFSGCDDDQISADTSALAKGATTGAMTYSFIKAIEHGHATTYGNMLKSMRSTIRSTDTDLGGGLVSMVITMLLSGGNPIHQEPQLTSNVDFDVYAKSFSL